MADLADMNEPRSYWRGVSDDQLRAARDEYRAACVSADLAFLGRVADDIDDDLLRRAAWPVVRVVANVYADRDPQS